MISCRLCLPKIQKVWREIVKGYVTLGLSVLLVLGLAGVCQAHFGVILPEKSMVMQGYLHEIRRLLEKHNNYPQMARQRHIQGVVVVVFTIAPGGQIMAAGVSRSSGHDLLDEAAQNTIRRVGQFPPFPAALNRQQLTIEVPLAFRLSSD